MFNIFLNETEKKKFFLINKWMQHGTYSRPCDCRNRRPNYNCNDYGRHRVRQTEVRSHSIRRSACRSCTRRRPRSLRGERKRGYHKDRGMAEHRVGRHLGLRNENLCNMQYNLLSMYVLWRIILIIIYYNKLWHFIIYK